jgi:hypothetical protein
VDAEAERVTGRTGIDSEHLVTVGVVSRFTCRLELTTSKRHGPLLG